MRINILSANCTEIVLQTGNTVIGFSYGTPVIVIVIDPTTDIRILYKTSKKHSRTTTKHIRMLSADRNGEVQEVPQEDIDNLVNNL